MSNKSYISKKWLCPPVGFIVNPVFLLSHLPPLPFIGLIYWMATSKPCLSSSRKAHCVHNQPNFLVTTAQISTSLVHGHDCYRQMFTRRFMNHTYGEAGKRDLIIVIEFEWSMVHLDGPHMGPNLSISGSNSDIVNQTRHKSIYQD